MIHKFVAHGLTFCLVVAVGGAAFSTTAGALQEKKKEAQRAEEADDYYARWLKETAIYIITSEEKSVFEKLTTPEEKENFI